jgi:hypothetical protein
LHLQSAEKAADYAQIAQSHAEEAARKLLDAKRAELQAQALLNGGKNPDPAATEVLKSQVSGAAGGRVLSVMPQRWGGRRN